MYKAPILILCFLLASISAEAVVTVKTYDYNDRDQVISITSDADPDNPVTFTYDDSGNRTSKTHNGVFTEYKWNPRGRLAEVSRNGMWFARYKYDYNGLRINKQIRPVGKSTQETRYTYDGKHLLFETNVIGNVLVRYHWGAGRLIGETRNGQNYYYFHDALGSIVAVTAQDGSVVARIDYDAFGNVRATQGSHEGLFGFAGYYADDETGLYYAQQRYYDSELGAFISEDSFEGVIADPPTLHGYLYAKANPTKYIDPDGRCNVGTMDFASIQSCAEEYRQISKQEDRRKRFYDIERGNYKGIGQAVGDMVEGTLQTAKDVGGTYVEAFSGGQLAKGSMLRLRGQVEATVDFVKHPIDSVKTAIRNHQLIVAELEKAGDYEGAAQERLRFRTTGALSVVGGGAGSLALRNKLGRRGPPPIEPPKTTSSFNDFSGIVTEGGGNKLTLKSFGDVDVQRNYYQYWTQKPIIFNGNKVFQRDNLISSGFIDERSGLSNLQLMKIGRAPIGPDGKPINLHHMTQRHDGAIAEVTQTFHQKNTKTIHINPSSIPSGIKRTEFNKWRSAYWKNRSQDFEVNSNEIQN